MESDNGARGSGLPEGDIGDGAGATHYADASLSAAGESGDAVDDVAAVGNLHDVGAEGVGAVAGDDDGGLGLVLGAGGSASGASVDLGITGGGGVFVFAVVAVVFAVPFVG